MKLLIVTQVVDSEDSILKFFHRWIEEFAKQCEQVEVICLKEGKHTLPANVHIHSLGKESGVSRVKYIVNFYTYIWRLRHSYDTVFVHMNPEYVVLGGLFWRAWSKRVALWYTHKSVNTKLRLGTLLAHTVFTASKESFRFKSAKVHVVGHGIDTEFFSPDPNKSRGTAVLSVGRLSETKRVDLIIQAAEYFPNEVRIIGNGPEEARLKKLAEQLSIVSRVHFLGSRTHEQIREECRTAALFIHTSETGSLDKVVLEALSCGLPVVTTAVTLADLPVTIVSPTPRAIAGGVLAARHTDSLALTAFVQEHHSLQRLIPVMMNVMRSL